MTPEVQAALDGLFRFRIGDLVTLGSMIPARGRLNEPQRLTILNRWVEQCSGGIQLAYDVRPIASAGIGQGFTTPIRVYDIELVAYPTDDTP